MKKLFVKLMSIGCVLLTACQSSQTTTTTMTTEAQKEEKMAVVTSFYPVYYMTKTIAGDVANVSLLLDGTVDAHDFEPSAQDIAKINTAKLFVYSSDEMETWAPKVKEGLKDHRQVTFVASGKEVELIEGEDDHGHEQHTHSESHKHDYDPHIWLDPKLAQTQVKTIAQALIDADPKNEAIYRQNKDVLLEKLEALHHAYETAFKHAKNKVFATQHAAFGYIAHRYHLEQIAVSGLLATEPSAQEIAQVIRDIKEHQLSVIYVDPNQSSKTAQTVAKEANVTVETLYTMESKVDHMDYLQLLQANLTALQKSIK